MQYSIVTTLLLGGISLLLQTARSAYTLADDYSGEAFFQSFDFFTDKDPTNGLVKYETLEKANATNLAGFMDGGNATKAIYMGVDTTSEAPDGRGSVRVSSAKSYQHALVVADIVHMPSVCGTSGCVSINIPESNLDQEHGLPFGWLVMTGRIMVSVPYPLRILYADNISRRDRYSRRCERPTIQPNDTSHQLWSTNHQSHKHSAFHRRSGHGRLRCQRLRSI